MSSLPPLLPVFFGHIASTHDALILFEACLSGRLNHLARRPFDRERPSLIKSGNVFVFEQHSSGIKRWTDGVPWSPSRVLTGFFVYRELERPLPPGDRRRATKKTSSSKTSNGKEIAGYEVAYTALSGAVASSPSPHKKEKLRPLVGSLVDSYEFKEGGLVKKTISVIVNGVTHHLIAYYTIADVLNGWLTTPSTDPRLQDISPRQDLVANQGFQTPTDTEILLDNLQDFPHNATAINSGFHSHGMPATFALQDIPEVDHSSTYLKHFPRALGAYGVVNEQDCKGLDDRERPSHTLTMESAHNTTEIPVFLHTPSQDLCYSNLAQRASIAPENYGFSSTTPTSEIIGHWGISHALMDTRNTVEVFPNRYYY